MHGTAPGNHEDVFDPVFDQELRNVVRFPRQSASLGLRCCR